MTYFGFLALFVGTPSLILALVNWRDRRRGRLLPRELRAFAPGHAAVALALAALLYTTPWDNYLVATGVWYYDPTRVTGIVLGWVPLEEYVFFVAQTALVALWFLFVARRLPSAGGGLRGPLRWQSAAGVGVLWLLAVVLLGLRWPPGTYLGLELAWFLPPVILQLTFGGDILWLHRRQVAAALLPAVAYLTAADGVAIEAGVWTIALEQSTGVLLGSLPLEELVFFAVTSLLIVFGMTLILAEDSIRRLNAWTRRLAVRR